MRKIPLIVFLLLAAAFTTLLLKGKDPAEVQSALIGKSAPAFALLGALKGKPGFSDRDLKGSPAVVNVFASWCLTCRIEQGALEKIAKDDKVPVYGLNYKDAPDKLEVWLKKYGNPYAAIGADTSGRTAIDWGVYGVPETFVVDAAGIVRYRHVGAVTEEVYREVFRPLLAELKK